MIAARLWMSGGGYITYEGHERFREFLMLVVISPAKKLDMSVDDRAPTTSPDFAADARRWQVSPANSAMMICGP